MTKWKASKSTGMCSMWQVNRGGHLVAGYIDTEDEARLIASAPDMLGALMEANKLITEDLAESGYGDEDMEDHPQLAQIRAAISAATGRARR